MALIPGRNNQSGIFETPVDCILPSKSPVLCIVTTPKASSAEPTEATLQMSVTNFG